MQNCWNNDNIIEIFLDSLTCDVFEVSGATDTSFNGKYEVTPFNVTGASADKEVYEKILGGGKYMFFKNGIWALGSNKDTGEISYAGIDFHRIHQRHTTWYNSAMN